MNNAPKKISRGFLLVLMVTVGHSPADANETIPENLRSAPSLPREAIIRYAETDLEEWFYSRTLHEDGVITVDRHDPTRDGPEHWQLVSIDGRAPSPEERKAYNADRADHSPDSEEKSTGDMIAAMLAPDSLRFVEQEGQQQRFAYEMQSPDGKMKRAFRMLEGDLTVIPGPWKPFISQVRVWNKQPFRPVLGLRVDEVTMDFAFTTQDRTVLPMSVDLSYRGAILMLKPLENSLRYELSGFRRHKPADLTVSGPVSSGY